MIWLWTAAAALILEAALIVTIRSLRREFQWLITEADELPALDPVALHKFVESSFDARLGWVRRPNTVGREKGRRGEITFHIDAAGSRQRAAENLPAVIAAFGDSYVFCRQVEDHETWEEALARSRGVGVMNFGVGNYGADQGLLRYESTQLPPSVRVVILGFVPETICRILSFWKHYLEFGNTFAFKPRFRLTGGGQLELLESAMKSEEDFQALGERLPAIQAADGFYERKFRSLQFRIPYLTSFARHPVRNARLVGTLLLRRALRLARASGRIENRPFALIMRQNIQDAHRLYADAAATALLRAILIRFRDAALARGHQPLVLVMPQLVDLRLGRSPVKPYQPFFRDLAADVPVLDVTSAVQSGDVSQLYVEDQYGGHFSAKGNEIVAGEIAGWLQQHGMLEPMSVAQ